MLKKDFSNYEYVSTDIIDKAIKGDKKATEIVVNRYLPYAKVTLINISKEYSLNPLVMPIEDMLQDIIIQYIKYIRKFK